MLSLYTGTRTRFLVEAGVCRFVRSDLRCLAYIVAFSRRRYGRRYISSAPSIPFGDLYRPSTPQERAIQGEIADKIPFDMIDDWKERKEIDFNYRLSQMPEQFAEASQRYSSEPKNYLLASVMRHCTKIRGRRWDGAEKSRFMASVSERTYELMDTLHACECGILLKCFLKLGYREYALQRALIERMLQRGQVFSPYGSISALNTIIECQSGHGTSLWKLHAEDITRLQQKLLSQIQGNLHKFNLATLSKVTNSISRMSIDVRDILHSIKDTIHKSYIATPANEALWTEEVVHFLANGFSRKGVLDKPLFDYLGDRIIESCPGYSIDTLVSLCNAYSKYGSAEDSKYVELFTSLANEIILQKRSLTSRHTCVVANAFAMCCICHDHLLEVLDDSFVFNIDSYDARQIAMMIHGFNKLGYRSRNHAFIWQKCTEKLDEYSWQGLSMIFHAYTKGESRQEDMDVRFCNRFKKLFCSMENRNESISGTTSIKAELPQPTTYVSLVYSLVKGNMIHDKDLVVHLAKGCHANIGCYEADEISNLALAFSKIYNTYSPKSSHFDETVWNMSAKVLEAVTKRLNDPSLKFSAFSMAKAIDSLGECAFTQSAQAVLRMIKRNILILDRLSYTHITGIIRALSTLGVHDEDVLSVLNSLKHHKNTRNKATEIPECLDSS